jgi:hypothetical protein
MFAKLFELGRNNQAVRSRASESEDTPVLDELDGGCIEALAAQSLGKKITFPLTHTMPL